ncbi:hypothetical protein SDC49_04545 [Lactobacillus sp. R2/2]|nr:hypothetical protein [Lactobacillus sp. R2/2]
MEQRQYSQSLITELQTKTFEKILMALKKLLNLYLVKQEKQN